MESVASEISSGLSSSVELAAKKGTAADLPGSGGMGGEIKWSRGGPALDGVADTLGQDGDGIVSWFEAGAGEGLDAIERPGDLLGCVSDE